VEIHCSPGEYVQIDTTYAIIRKDLAREFDTFLTAFIAANDLWSKRDKKSDREPTEEEVEQYIRAKQMARNIQASQVHKQIEEN
jgi:hypothetical protein